MEICNRLEVSAVLCEKKALRFTPSGYGVFEGVFHHVSQVCEAGADRTVEMDFEALAIGDAALGLDRVSEGTEMTIRGFIAPRSIRNKRLTVHITEFEI